MNRFQIFIIHIDIENMGIWFVTPIPANQIIRIPFSRKALVNAKLVS